MSFTVTARVSARRFVYQHASVLNALDQGLSLVAAGMQDVRIIDGAGLARQPDALFQALFGPEAERPAGAAGAAPEALAA